MPLPYVVPGLGTDLLHGVAGSPATYTSIAAVTTIDPNEESMDEAETTNLKSGNKTFRAVIKDLGTLAFTIQYAPTSTVHKLLKTLFAAKTNELWKLVFADDDETEIFFTGFIKKFKVKGTEVNGNLEAEVEIRVNEYTYPT